MSELGERISEIVKDSGLTRTAFAEKIGLTQSYVSGMCLGKKVPGDRTVKDICREFGINEDWLRNGKEPKRLGTSASDLGDYIRQRGASDLETQILRAYFDLDKDTRRNLLEHFKARLSSMSEGEKVGGETVVETIAETTRSKLDIDAETADFRASLELQEKVEEKSSASNGLSGTCEGKMA